ncbi:hypothetical protein [Kribbella sindirgiensis]|uniref:Uncharacterized protein n=1 Tax=Kribbella sindirgiensis TaxID=1124744 RepID=A0A4R0I527_9ACTN|nr:hypothetical protein [Kribbella sindirgiensis]TCC19963.1 hypothetical protein E0H50_37700 [Kribbella sindirgiensis]
MIAGRGPSPAIVNTLARALPDTCLTVALASGGREFRGWGVDRHLDADLYDALNQNTRATGQWAKKAPDIPPYPRPTSSKPEERPKTKSVAELYRGFSGRK